MQPNADRYRPDIDGLRAIAVLSVVLFHAGLGFRGGFLGVDLFFVISGYLITGLISRDLDAQCFSLVAFYERRVRRIVPALVVVIGVTLAVASVLFMPDDLVLLGRSAVAAAVMLSNMEFWHEAGYFDTSAQIKPLLHTWSLGVEEQFYLVFPLLLLALRKRLPRFERPILAILVAASLLLGFWWVKLDPVDAFYLAPARFWELGSGGLLALTVRASPGPRLAVTATSSGLVAIIAAVLLAHGHNNPSIGALAVCLGTLLVIYGGLTANPASRLLSGRLPVSIGRISYSLYLIHWPMIVFFQYREGRQLDATEALLVIAASIALAAVSWRLIERPVRARSILPRRSALFAAMGGAAAALCLSGVSLVLSGGLPDRLPPDVLAVLHAKHDGNPYSGPTCFMQIGGGERGLTYQQIRDGQLCPAGVGAGRPSFLVWGDSHAPAMAPAIVAAAESRGLHGLVVGHGGCLPLLDYQTSSRNAARTASCKAFNSAVGDYLNRAQIPLVFLVGRWPREVLGAEYGNEGRFFDPTAAYRIQDRSEIVAKSLDQTLKAIIDSGSLPVLVMDVPEPGYDVPYTLARRLENHGNLNIGPSRRIVDARQLKASAILYAAAQKYGLSVINPTPVFCYLQQCRVTTSDGKPLYVDADHLSVTGALTLEHLYEPVFAALNARTAKH